MHVVTLLAGKVAFRWLTARRPPASRFGCAQRSPQRSFQCGPGSILPTVILEKTNQLALDRPHPKFLVFGWIFRCVRPFELERARKVALQHCGMDVTFTADGGGIPKLFRYLFDNLQGARFGGLHLVQFVQPKDREVSPGPRAKILGSYFLA